MPRISWIAGAAFSATISAVAMASDETPTAPADAGALVPIVADASASVSDRQRAVEELRSERASNLSGEIVHELLKGGNPTAEEAVVDKLFAPETEGSLASSILWQLSSDGGHAATRAMLRWAAPRPDVRDLVSFILAGWLRERGPAAVGDLAALLDDPDPEIAGLARAFLERCAGRSPGPDAAEWVAWAGKQSKARWHEIAENPRCSLPSAPDGGKAADGSEYVRVVRAVRTLIPQGWAGTRTFTYAITLAVPDGAVCPYALALGSRCARLTEWRCYSKGTVALSAKRTEGVVSPGFMVHGAEGFQGGPYWSWNTRASCRATRPLDDSLGSIGGGPRPPNAPANDEGQFIFLVDGRLHQVTFPIESPPQRVLPVP